MKRTFLFSILAAVMAVLLPSIASSQVASPVSGSSEPTGPVYKYGVFVGYGYTSLNQVNGARYGLQGINAQANRDFGKYFAMVADGRYYKYSLSTGGATTAGNPGDPSVVTFLVGPEGHADIYGHVSGFVHAMVGTEHTGGEKMNPSTSFSGAFGGGLEYTINHRYSVRLMGDRVGGSFSLINNSSTLRYSSHLTWNSTAAIGVRYRF